MGLTQGIPDRRIDDFNDLGRLAVLSPFDDVDAPVLSQNFTSEIA